LDLLPVGQTQVVTHTPVLERKAACKRVNTTTFITSCHFLSLPVTSCHVRSVTLFLRLGLPHGPRSAEPGWSQTACRDVVLSGGFRTSFFIALLPYGERRRRRRRRRRRKRRKRRRRRRRIIPDTIISILVDSYRLSFTLKQLSRSQ